MDEILLIDKPTGISSFGVVARVRRIYSQRLGRRVKVGHAGTLDPFASGLLVIMVGKATKKATEFLKLDKAYEAELCLGASSTTGDPEGEISQVSTYRPSRQEIEKVLSGRRGAQLQTPPAFSAIKVNGQRAYKLARQGKQVNIEPRQINIYELEMIDYNYPQLRIKTKVSSGTYIRSLAEDIGRDLKTAAYLTALRRTVIGDFDIAEAHSLDDLEK